MSAAPAQLDREASRRIESRRRRRPYRPYGAARALFRRRDPELLMAGPAGTGKSRAILEKVNLAAMKYPGMRALLLRQTKESITESVLVTFEEHVVPERSPMLEGANRHNRQFYEYANGSVIVVGGLDKSSRIMSTEYDMIAVFECTEVSRESFEDLTTRLRNGVMPYQQIIADCNPDQPFHWLNLRPDEPGAKMVRLRSRHEDNPTLWDHHSRDWTERGRNYITKLDALTGAKKQRLRHGRWVAAEGAVYEEEWNPAVNLVSREDFDPRTIRYYFASIDWGFRNPGVLLVWALDNDDRMFCVAQVYRRGQTTPWWIAQYKRLAKEYPIQCAVADPSEPGAISEFRQAGVRMIEANNDVTLGIEHVRNRLRGGGDGPALFYLEDSLQAGGGRDEGLVEDGLPWCARQEFPVYVYPKGLDGKAIKEEPVKLHDHACDAARYAVMHADARSAAPVATIQRTGKSSRRGRGLRARPR